MRSWFGVAFGLLFGFVLLFAGRRLTPGAIAVVLTVFDLLRFVSLFNASDGAADCDGTGLLDLFDLVHDKPQAGHVATQFEQRVGRKRHSLGRDRCDAHQHRIDHEERAA